MTARKTIEHPTCGRDICISAMNAAIAIGSDWSLKAPRSPGQPFIIKIWEPVSKPLTEEEKGQLPLIASEANQ